MSQRWLPLHKPEIEALLGTRPVAKTAHFALHRQAPRPVPSDLSTDDAPERTESVDNLPRGWAALIPKRHARRAVTRNLIRRQVRESVGSLDEPSMLLVRLRAPFDARAFASAASDALRAAVRDELSQLLQQRLERA